MEALSIAPCSINCGVCRSFLRNKNRWHGCRNDSGKKSNASKNCSVRCCDDLSGHDYLFCFSCIKYPCPKLLFLDSRYQKRYKLSVVANLERIRFAGLDAFLAEEDSKWRCPKCGSHLCMHKPECIKCGYIRDDCM